MKKFLYYLFVLYFFLFIGTFFSWLIEDIPFLKRMTISLGYAIWNLLFAIPYNIFAIISILLTYFFSEIRKYKTGVSFLLAYTIGFTFLIIYATISSKLRNTLDREITFWDSLTITKNSIFDPFVLFLIGTFLFILLMIPIHKYFRRRFKFLNEAN